MGDDSAAFRGIGIHGKLLYATPAADVEMARFASHPLALDHGVQTLFIDAMGALACGLAG